MTTGRQRFRSLPGVEVLIGGSRLLMRLDNLTQESLLFLRVVSSNEALHYWASHVCQYYLFKAQAIEVNYNVI